MSNHPEKHHLNNNYNMITDVDAFVVDDDDDYLEIITFNIQSWPATATGLSDCELNCVCPWSVNAAASWMRKERGNEESNLRIRSL